jgi:type I restriction enzyme S subunit
MKTRVVQKTGRLGDLFKTAAGGTPSTTKREYYEGGTIPWLNSGEVRQGVVCSAKTFITELGLQNSNAKIFPKDTVLVALYGATAAQVGILAIEAATNQAVFGIYPNSSFLPKFIFYFLLSCHEELSNQAVGSAQPNLSGLKIKDLRVPLVSLAEQQRIVAVLDEAFAGLATAQANAEKNLQNARELFDSYLEAVFTQHEKGWAERRLGDESLVEIIDGDRGANYPKTTDFNKDGHCLFLNTKNVRPDGFNFESTVFITAEKDGQLRNGKLKRDDVVLTTRGTIGNIGLYSEDVPYEHIRINSGMLIFRPNNLAMLPDYLFELFRSNIVKDQIRKQTTGAAQPQLPIKTLVNFVIPVPTSLDDQVSMVKKLRAFEPETQRLQKIYEQKLVALAELKKSLLHQAFSGEL